jgi:hypothetical protein
VKLAHGVSYVSGLDLGPPQGFTALAVLEQTEAADPHDPERTLRHYAVRHLQRRPPATPYPEVCHRVAGLFTAPPLAGSFLAVDYTGVGRPILDMLRRVRVQARICPVMVTAGHKAAADQRGGWCVLRRELAATLQVLLQSRRLRVSPALSESATLVRELAAFNWKAATAAEEELNTWREGAHDDLVLAVAVAAWIAERALQRLVIGL